MRTALIAFTAAAFIVVPSSPAQRVVRAAQIAFEQAQRDLASPDASTRLRTVRMLREAAFPEAAVPLAALVADQRDEIQLEAIAAEVNIFLADRTVPNKRVGFDVEKRGAAIAEWAFSSGPSAIGSLPVPKEVLTALRSAARDDNPRVGVEALYAFGALGRTASGTERRDLLRASGPDVAALLGSPDSALRHAAVRVMGRLFAPQPADDPVEATVGDAVITALNDDDGAVKSSAMEALGSMRYVRGVQALTDLFQFYGKGVGAEGALDALARIAYPASAPLFSAQLQSKSAAMRGIAIEGIARLGSSSALVAVQVVLDSERNDATLLAGAFATAMLGNGSLDPIAAAITKSKLRGQARAYLAELAPGRASAFTKYLADPDERIRFDAVDALGLAGDPSALPLVEPLTRDHDPDVARAAERVVAHLRQISRKPAG